MKMLCPLLEQQSGSKVKRIQKMQTKYIHVWPWISA